MKNFLSLLLFTYVLLNFTPAFADDNKTFALSDGTKIVGKLISVQNGTYTIQTSQLGTIQLKDAQIKSITTGFATDSSSSAQTNNQSQNLQMDKTQLQGQVQQLQGQLMADPQFMAEIQTLINDEEVKTILSDPEVMQAVTSYDAATIQNNPKLQRLL